MTALNKTITFDMVVHPAVTQYRKKLEENIDTVDFTIPKAVVNIIVEYASSIFASLDNATITAKCIAEFPGLYHKDVPPRQEESCVYFCSLALETSHIINRVSLGDGTKRIFSVLGSSLEHPPKFILQEGSDLHGLREDGKEISTWEIHEETSTLTFTKSRNVPIEGEDTPISFESVPGRPGTLAVGFRTGNIILVAEDGGTHTSSRAIGDVFFTRILQRSNGTTYAILENKNRVQVGEKSLRHIAPVHPKQISMMGNILVVKLAKNSADQITGIDTLSERPDPCFYCPGHAMRLHSLKGIPNGVWVHAEEKTSKKQQISFCSTTLLPYVTFATNTQLFHTTLFGTDHSLLICEVGNKGLELYFIDLRTIAITPGITYDSSK